MSVVVPDSGLWRCLFEVESFLGDVRPGDEPIDHVEFENLLMYGGASCLLQGLIGNITGTAGQALTRFDNTNAAIGAGDSTTAAVATHTDLQAVTNKLRKGMDATYPLHTDGTTIASNVITFRSTFGTSDANFDWQEIGIFNSPTAATGRMLNRKTQAIGVKTSSISRVVTATITLA